MSDIVDEPVGVNEKEQRWRAAEAAIARLREDPNGWNDYQAEAAWWDGTSADGLDELPYAFGADTEEAMRQGDIVAAADLARAALEPAMEADWSVPAGDLEWSCRRTLDHIVDTLLLYGAYVATRATERRAPIRNGDPEATISRLFAQLGAAARILELVCAGSPPPVRAFHPSGLSDADGYRAMACSEILTHADDIARGLDLAFMPPADLCERVMARVFPWAPEAAECPDRWAALRWCCGRTALPSQPRLDERWWWHAAPIAEWDGTRNKRTAPPAWQ